MTTRYLYRRKPLTVQAERIEEDQEILVSRGLVAVKKGDYRVILPNGRILAVKGNDFLENYELEGYMEEEDSFGPDEIGMGYQNA
jgi:hypothetical protein